MVKFKVLVFSLLFCSVLIAQQKRPDIVFIFSDDQTTISAYGNALNKTPNIDRIAANGMVFKFILHQFDLRPQRILSRLLNDMKKKLGEAIVKYKVPVP